MSHAANLSGLELTGEAFAAIIHGFSERNLLAPRILERLELAGDASLFDPSGHYPLSQVFALLGAVEKEMGDAGLVKTGSLVPKHAKYPAGDPPDVRTALAQLDAGYHHNHRKDGRPMLDLGSGAQVEGIGHYAYSELGPRAVCITVDSLYPCAFDRGIILGLGRRFEPLATVTEEPGCRRQGGGACRYVIRW